MAIGNAVQRGTTVHVYDEKGRPLFSKPAGNDKDDGLKGYTSSAVNIRHSNRIYSYDEKGRQTASTLVR